MAKKIKKYIIILLGEIITAFAISCFYTPNKVVNGGVSGIATILYHTLSVPTGLSFVVINVLLLLVSLKFLGKQFVGTTIIGSLLLSAFVQLFSYLPPVTTDIFLASVFGSALYGVGIGLTLIEGASTGGTDIISRLIQCFFPHVKIGSLLLVVDAIVIGASLCVFRNMELTLFGILSLVLASASINMLISKLNISKLAFVISDNGLDISKTLVSESPRGVTLLDATGAYTMEEKHVLICALKENEIPRFQERILEMDKDAFIIFSESKQIVGNGFRVYK